jgi:acyl carrier protein
VDTALSDSASETERVLMELLRKSLPERVPPLTPRTALVGDLGLESIQVIEYLCEVEDHFDLAIDEDTLADVHTIGDLARVIDRLARR